jgi:hypothetical protein
MEISNEAQEYVDQWRTIFKEGRDKSIRFINKSFNSMEGYFAALGPNKLSEKEKSSPKT